MPIYEYRCENGHTFEVMQSFRDDPIAECQTCSLPVEKVFHPVAIHFKGKGFHNTDYGTRKRSREGSESDGSTAGESKPADKDSSTSGSSDTGAKAKSDSKAGAASAKSASD
jgi:putative FmdB family regulatory protein